jgi:hypothetical protein
MFIVEQQLDVFNMFIYIPLSWISNSNYIMYNYDCMMTGKHTPFNVFRNDMKNVIFTPT